jgi:hypothetical protein
VPGAEQRERGRKEDLDGVAGGRRRRPDKARTERGKTEEEGGMKFPKDLCANLENYRDLSVKHKFLINLKP